MFSDDVIYGDWVGFDVSFNAKRGTDSALTVVSRRQGEVVRLARTRPTSTTNPAIEARIPAF